MKHIFAHKPKMKLVASGILSFASCKNLPCIDPANVCKSISFSKVHKLFCKVHASLSKETSQAKDDALPSPGVNPLEGSPKSSCGKLGLGRRSRLLTLKRNRGSSWEPRD